MYPEGVFSPYYLIDENWKANIGGRGYSMFSPMSRVLLDLGMVYHSCMLFKLQEGQWICRSPSQCFTEESQMVLRLQVPLPTFCSLGNYFNRNNSLPLLLILNARALVLGQDKYSKHKIPKTTN